jgi:hypothetical protein
MVLAEVVNQQSLSSDGETLNPNVTYIDNKIVILAVRILVGKVLEMLVLRCSDTCQREYQKQTQQTYAA